MLGEIYTPFNNTPYPSTYFYSPFVRYTDPFLFLMYPGLLHAIIFGEKTWTKTCYPILNSPPIFVYIYISIVLSHNIFPPSIFENFLLSPSPRWDWEKKKFVLKNWNSLGERGRRIEEGRKRTVRCYCNILFAEALGAIVMNNKRYAGVWGRGGRIYNAKHTPDFSPRLRVSSKSLPNPINETWLGKHSA